MHGNDQVNTLKHQSNTKNRLAMTSFVLGIISVIVLILFPPGYVIPISIISFILGIVSRHSNQREYALAGVAISSFMFVLLFIAVIFLTLIYTGILS